jgi:malonyl-CoA O-methyltransferase
VLDLGAGTGVGAAALAARFPRARVLALDLVPEMLIAGGAANRSAVCGDGCRLPFAAASVDMVFCNLMLPWCAPAAVFLRSAALSFQVCSRSTVARMAREPA